MSIELLVEICKLAIIACGCFFVFWALINFIAGLAPAHPLQLAFYKSNIIDGLICSATLLLALFLFGCTPRNNLAHQYHVASVTINGERTETGFLLEEK